MLSWMPQLFRHAPGGNASGFAPPSAILLPEATERSVRLVFLGDISSVACRAAPTCDETVVAFLRSADLVVANCESPVVQRPRARLRTRLGIRHAMDAGFLLGVLAAAGVEPDRLVLSLANNHALDQGVAGFEETLAALANLGIRTIGTAATDWVEIFEIGPLAVGLMAFTQWRNGSRRHFAGRVRMAGELEDWSHVPAKPADILCAIPHWDWQMRHFPHEETRMLARALASRGVNLIVGHHAHVVQPVERVEDTLVAYGLGDFLGTCGRRPPWSARIGAMLVADLSTEEETRGQVAAYGLLPFLRQKKRGQEHIAAVGSLEEKTRQHVEARLDAIWGAR